ncbi:putative death domain-associated protein 6 [Apostichopus japonicus]|uniref:Putative death domain-associated protein 6 n=1 Tax=Stichopus japonicus TaxID=307972 RepID=A0A2G8LC56_STIJA|nr:putative death domain-associated protein 6 [Apostichopus japonicus]
MFGVQFQELCKTVSPSSKRELVDNSCAKLQQHYDVTSSEFLKSEEFEVILKRHLNILSGDNGVKSMFKCIWDLKQILKVRERSKTTTTTTTVQNGTKEVVASTSHDSSQTESDFQQPSHSKESTINNRQGAAPDSQDTSRNDKTQRRIEKLEKKLGKLHRAIQKLSERELTLDEMEDERSIHIQEHRLRNRFVKGWDMLCKLKKISNSAGRAKEDRLFYRSSNYREINVKITKLMNKPDYFPDYQDVLTVIQKANEKQSLGIDEVEVGVLAREIFVDIGGELKKRRQADLIQSFGTQIETASESRSLSKKLTEEMDKFSQEQKVREARGEDLEAASTDEEEEEEEENEEWVRGGKEDVGNCNSDQEQPPTKKLKTVKEVCEDGTHCGTDSETSDHDIGKVSEAVGKEDVESGASDIDIFLQNDETEAVLTSEEESSMAEGGEDESESGGAKGLNGFNRHNETSSLKELEVVEAALSCRVDNGRPVSPPDTSDSDPIDNLGVEGLVPVTECHSYAFVQIKQGSQSAGTSGNGKIGNGEPSEDSSDYIEILDSSSPSPPVYGGKDSEVRSQSECDVVIISDSD